MSAPLPPSAPFPPPSRGTRTRGLAARILWAAVPFWTVGIAGWAPAVHIARRRRTREAWWWVAALAASTVAEFVVVELIPKKANVEESFIGDTVVLGYLITATVYAWRGCGADLPALRPVSPPVPPQPWYGAAPTIAPMPFPAPAPMSAPAPTPAPAATVAPTPTAAILAAPTGSGAAQDMAAEIQADLRELRGLLGGEDAR
ncbi:hypothetical protein ABH920_000651 [Catenulispora sp. EB89]|uniref:hypothetical protein n=1 Tax=Catenulispora sp. EB89 TaxID=3156257 RepID=UPI003515402A